MMLDIPIWQLVLYLFGAYLMGSIPTAYLAGRLLRGIDIRDYGSGNVGGSNAGDTLGRPLMFIVGFLDIVKAAVPTWIALVPLDLGYEVATAAGLAATIGHNWSIFLRFTGGRGLSCFLGALVIVFPWGAVFLISVIIAGYFLKSTAGSTVGLLGLPFFSLALDMPAAMTWGCLGMILITALKRLEANRAPLPSGPERWHVIWRRLWLDRDIEDHEEWLSRRPPGE
jgi:glycerol-3-phosphate acyltransferase PlsY